VWVRSVRILASRSPESGSGGIFSLGTSGPGLAAEFKQGRELHYPNRTHFLPMEIPDEVAALISEDLIGEPQ